MHRIVKAHLDSFVKSYGIENHEEDVQFELFCNKAMLSSRISMDFEIDDVTTGAGDDGMDGIAIIIDEELCISPEDASSVFPLNVKITMSILFLYNQSVANHLI